MAIISITAITVDATVTTFGTATTI